MTQDYEISRNIWESHVPVEFTLECDGVIEQPKPFYAMLPRISYFPLVLPKVLAYFSSLCEEVKLDLDKTWLEYSRQQIKMYYPIGVLFDVLKSDELLPWTVSVKTKEIPSGSGNLSKDALEAMFMQSLKEADYLRRKAEVITSMKSEDHKHLWKGLTTGNFEEFWTVNKRLVDATDAKVTHLPIRLYRKNAPMRQAPISPMKDSGEDNTLKDALTILDPGLNVNEYLIRSHGIEIPLHTSINWLAQNFGYPDNFVHLSAVPH